MSSQAARAHRAISMHNYRASGITHHAFVG